MIIQCFFGKVCVKFPLFDRLLEGRHFCKKQNIWNYSVSKCLLEPFDLHEKVPVISQRRVMQLEQNDGLVIENGTVEDRFVCPLPRRPFWIANSAILCDNGAVPFSMTPMYSGIPKKVKIGNNIIGNYFIETMGVGMSKPDIRLSDFIYHTSVEVKGERHFTIGDMIGTSSAAFSFFSEKLANKIGNVLGTVGYDLYEIDQEYNMWCLDNDNDQSAHYDIKLVDGYRANNTGILPLLARGCKKILMFVNNLSIRKNYCNTDLYELFGICSQNCNFPGLTDTVKVFNEDDWNKMEEQFEDHKIDGGPVYCRVKLPVLENKHNCIKGGYDVELLIYLLYPSQNFIDRLPSEIASEIKKDGKFDHFPNYKTVFQNDDSMSEYTPEQFNLLFYYTQWCLKETEDIVRDFCN